MLDIATGPLAISALANCEGDFGLRVQQVEGACMKQPQVDCPVRHHFYPGIYMREVFIPAGTFSIGHHQNTEHINILAKGTVTMFNEDGSMEVLTAPLTFSGKPGRKVGIIHEDMTWFNVYLTNERDVEKLEATYLTKSPGFLLATQQAALDSLSDSVSDYGTILHELGLNQEQVDLVVHNEDDLVDMPSGSYKFQVGPSPIHGRGVFSVGGYAAGEEIGIARIGENRTPLGRYTNHSKTPNATVLFSGDDVYFHAIRDIRGNAGGILGEEITIDYRGPLGEIYNKSFK